ncbi:MAG TPA: adenosine kinase [Porticoccaceae bacterium]
MAHKYHVVGIGAALVDTEIEVEDQDLATLGVDKGLMTLVDEKRQLELVNHLAGHLTASRRASGGSAANTIIAVSAFGGRTFFCGRVADDDNGHFYLADLDAAGVDHPRVDKLPDGTTGKCLVLITPDAERSMNTFLGASEGFSVADLDLDVIASAEYLYIEGYLATSPTGRAAAVAAREHGQENGTKIALSLSDPGIVAHFRPQLEEILGNRVELLFCNLDEAMSWTGTRSLEAAAEALTRDADQFAITLGAKGAAIFDGNELHHIPARAITAVDTNGAGDMFAGAFLYGLSHGMDHATAGLLACTASAAVVGQYGPRLPLEQYKGILDAFQ